MKLKQIVKGALLGGVVGLLSQCATPPAAAPVPSVGAARAGISSDFLAKPQTVEMTQRPGIATGWGDRLESEIQYTNFQRQSAKPSSMQVMYYNDKKGVEAMTPGWSYSGSGLQKSPDRLVEWGVKSGWGYAKNVRSGGKRFVVGKHGATYSLVVKNVCESRLEIVLSVDGLDVMDGQPASVKKRGYIVMPRETLTVKGFRTSEDAVAAFKFSTVDHGYSQMKHGTTRNVGVIGMAVFTEKGISPWKYGAGEIRERNGARAFAEAPMMKAR